MDTLTVRACTPDDPAVRAVIEAHFALMRSQTPEESCHVLPAEALLDAYMVAARAPDAVIGIGALVSLGEGHSEIKSMHTTATARGKGVARAILGALLEEAKRQGGQRVSLETGSAPEFTAARALYRSAGFSECGPFGPYTQDPSSVFMTCKI